MDKKKKSILLINPGHENNLARQHTVPHRTHRDIPPISILTLGSYLKKHNENVVILDSHIDKNYKENLEKIIVDENIGLVGITVFVGNFSKNAQEMTEIIKCNHPEIPVVWGGALTSTLPEACLKEGGADYIIFFSGEEPLRLLIESLRNKTKKESIPNIGFLKNGSPFYTKQDWDPVFHSDPLDWELLKDNINFRQVPYLAYIFTSRGCPYGCRFCYHQMSSAKNLRKFFVRDAESVINEVDGLNKRYGINVFTFGDDNFFLNKERAIRILNAMRERGCYIEQASGTFSDFNDEVISNLNGICQTIICSIETASEKLRKLISKPIKLSKIPEINLKLSRFGINTVHNIMFGLPGETDDDRKAAVDLMVKLKDINPYVRGVAYFFTPLPGTPIMEDIESSYGKFPRTLSFWKDCEYAGFENSYKFRPWLTSDDQAIISDFINIFKDVFQSVNSPLTKDQAAKINSSSRLKYIFSNIRNVNFPKDKRQKYLLDEILKAKRISC